MPNVPTVTLPSVAPSPSAGLPYQSSAGATPAAFGGDIATAEQGFARQLEQSGDMLAKHAIKMQEDANVTSAEKLFLDQDIKLGKLTEEYNSKQGSARVNALPKFQEDAVALRDEGLNASPNPDVKRKFDQLFTRQLGFSVKAAGRESASAFRADQKATSNAVVANSMNNIARNANDDQQFLASTQNGLESQRALPEYQGASDEVKQYMDRTLVSGAWATRLQSMAATDPLRARELFKKNKEQLDGDVQLKLEPLINQKIIQKDTAIASDQIIGDLGSKTMEERIKKLEGYSEKPYWDYKQSTSGYGTKAQPGDEAIPPEERKAVYTQRLRNELASAYQIVDNNFPGLPKGARDALASLTFNAGSGWTRQGLGQAIREGDMEKAKAILPQYNKVTNPDGTKSELGALTRRRAEELTWWNNDTTEAPTDPVKMQTAAFDKARERAAKVFPDDPVSQAEYLDKLQQKITGDTRVMEKAARDLQLQTRNIVQAELFTPDNAVTSYDKLSARAQQAYDQAPPLLKKSFDDAMIKNSKADVALTPERQFRFDALRGEATLPSTVDKFMSRDLSSIDLPRTQLSMLKKMQDDRKALLEKGAKMAPYMASMRGDLNDLQINESRTDTARNEEFLKFRGVYEKQLMDFAEEKKRPANEQEGREIGKKLLKDIVTGPGYIFGDSWPYTDRAYRAIADKTPIQLRADDPQAHYATLPRGATYKGPDGETRVKP